MRSRVCLGHMWRLQARSFSNRKQWLKQFFASRGTVQCRESHAHDSRCSGPSSVRPASRILWFAIPVALYVLSVALTQPPFIGDTIVYARQISAARNFSDTQLWEFGHVLLRPIGFVCSPLFLALIPDAAAWTPALKIAYGLEWLNLVSGLIAVVLIADLCRRLMANVVWVIIPALVFVWGDALLAYSQSGSSYIPALACLLGGMWWQLTRPRAAIAGPALMYGLAALFWFPFALVIPAASCARILAPKALSGGSGMSWGQAFQCALLSGALLGAGIGTAAIMAGVHSFPQLHSWVSSASHDQHQNRQLVRAVSGCARLLIDLGGDGVYLKRFTFKDPYNPVSAAAIFRLTVWKLGLFYLFLGAVVLLVWRTIRDRPLLALLTLATVPLFLFAVFLFEPSSPERFLPALPFLILALAAGWNAPGGFPVAAARGVVCLFALLLPVLNWPTFSGSFSFASQQARAQLADFRFHAQRDDVLVTVLLDDPVMQVVNRLFDPINRPAPVRAYNMIEMVNVANWRRSFARLILDNWHGNRNVWVLKEALGDRPGAGSKWVEGDNPAVRWEDVAQFLRMLEFDRQTSLPNGLVRIRRSEELERRLSLLAANTACRSGLIIAAPRSAQPLRTPAGIRGRHQSSHGPRFQPPYLVAPAVLLAQARTRRLRAAFHRRSGAGPRIC